MYTASILCKIVHSLPSVHKCSQPKLMKIFKNPNPRGLSQGLYTLCTLYTASILCKYFGTLCTAFHLYTIVHNLNLYNSFKDLKPRGLSEGLYTPCTMYTASFPCKIVYSLPSVHKCSQPKLIQFF